MPTQKNIKHGFFKLKSAHKMLKVYEYAGDLLQRTVHQFAIYRYTASCQRLTNT